jgi:hypothetical protein
MNGSGKYRKKVEDWYMLEKHEILRYIGIWVMRLC